MQDDTDKISEFILEVIKFQTYEPSIRYTEVCKMNFTPLSNYIINMNMSDGAFRPYCLLQS